MPRVFDLECNLPSEAAESDAGNELRRLGPRNPNRTEPLAGYGIANYGTIFASRQVNDAAPAVPPTWDELVTKLNAAGVEKAVLADP